MEVELGNRCAYMDVRKLNRRLDDEAHQTIDKLLELGWELEGKPTLTKIAQMGFKYHSGRGNYQTYAKDNLRTVYDTSRDVIIMNYQVPSQPMDPECR